MPDTAAVIEALGRGLHSSRIVVDADVLQALSLTRVSIVPESSSNSSHARSGAFS